MSESRKIRTGAERVVRPLELLAGGVVLTPGSDALEVVGVVLEAARGQEDHRRNVTNGVSKREQSGGCGGIEKGQTSASSGFG